MIKRTHLAIAVALALLFLPHINSSRLIFLVVIVISALLPDIDSSYSYFGRNKLLRPLQFISEHRGFIHSFTFCLFISLIFAFFVPVLTLPFFAGYASHLIADSFTVEGITPFWPSKKTMSGPLLTGGKGEYLIFICFAVLDLILFFRLFYLTA